VSKVTESAKRVGASESNNSSKMLGRKSGGVEWKGGGQDVWSVKGGTVRSEKTTSLWQGEKKDMLIIVG